MGSLDEITVRWMYCLFTAVWGRGSNSWLCFDVQFCLWLCCFPPRPFLAIWWREKKSFSCPQESRSKVVCVFIIWAVEKVTPLHPCQFPAWKIRHADGLWILDRRRVPFPSRRHSLNDLRPVTSCGMAGDTRAHPAAKAKKSRPTHARADIFWVLWDWHECKAGSPTPWPGGHRVRSTVSTALRSAVTSCPYLPPTWHASECTLD